MNRQKGYVARELIETISKQKKEKNREISGEEINILKFICTIHIVSLEEHSLLKAVLSLC